MTRPPPPDDLDDAWNDAWQRLVRAVNDRKHAFRTPVLATVGPDGGPRSRVVVLRGADPTTGELVFHTDARSGKVVDLAGQPLVSWCFYDARARLQLRARGPLDLRDDTQDVDAAWARTSPMARRTYLCEPGPGTPLSGPASGLEHLDGAIEPDPDVAAEGRRVFRRGVCRLQTLERLDLAIGGHRRMRWRRAEPTWHGAWLVP